MTNNGLVGLEARKHEMNCMFYEFPRDPDVWSHKETQKKNVGICAEQQAKGSAWQKSI